MLALTFNPTPRLRVYVMTEYVLVCCCICDHLKIDMKRDNVLKKL